MNESRFIELVNLYVDHELTPAEAAELEAELQRAPERRVVLREYRALQRGCELLVAAERSLAPQTAEAVRSLRYRRAETQPAARAWSGGWSWVVGASAAAAIAVVAVLHLRPSIPQSQAEGTLVASTEQRGPIAPSAREAGTATLEMLDVVVPSVPIGGKGLRMASAWNVRSADRESSSAIIAVASSDLSWLDDVRLPAVRAPRPEDLLFRERAMLSRAIEPMPPSQRPLQATLEMTAFQFQR